MAEDLRKRCGARLLGFHVIPCAHEMLLGGGAVCMQCTTLEGNGGALSTALPPGWPHPRLRRTAAAHDEARASLRIITSSDPSSSA
jgi:hypothetical protein